MHLVAPFWPCDCLVLDVEIGEHGFQMSQRTSSCCCCCLCCCRLVLVMVWWWFGYGESWRMMAFFSGFLLLIMNVWAHEICRFAFASWKIVTVGWYYVHNTQGMYIYIYIYGMLIAIYNRVVRSCSRYQISRYYTMVHRHTDTSSFHHFGLSKSGVKEASNWAWAQSMK